jgi:diguanylate cyclase (GGDEF)-like protein
MMFWKFQSHTPPSPEPGSEQQASQQQPAPITFAPPQTLQAQAGPTPAPAPAAPPPAADAADDEVPSSYQQAAERTMRFLAETLQIPSWVLFKNLSGALHVITGSGDYERVLAGRELSVGRLSDLPTINVLGAAPPVSVSGGIDRRSGGIDPATVAPYGVPLVDADGKLFAILCALGEHVAPERLAQVRPVLDYALGMLGAVVRTELTLEEEARRAERAQADALVDPLTALHNRRAWDQLLSTEDQRCSRHGYDAVIFVVDLDGLKAINDRFGHEKGDELIRNAATALERSVRRTDVVARVGGDEFAILAVKCDAGAAARIRDHIESTLMRANSPATVGFSVRSEAGDLFEAWRQADGAMYHRKRGKPGRAAETDTVPVTEPPPEIPQAAAPVEEEIAVAPSLSEESTESSTIAQILEKILPALVTGIQKAAPHPAPQPAEPMPIPPRAEPTPPPPPPPPIPAAAPPPIPEPQPAPAPPQPSEDLIDIVSRLSRLSDADRRLLDVFFKGST